ncbi:MAG: class I SAM-dependent methyltransferase, partial [Candidatus Bipolaricaulota bacterium]
YDQVKRFAGRNRLLDLGTGGGLKVMKLADHFTEVVAIDSSEKMIATAQKHLRSSCLDKVRFLLMDATQLAFAPESFDVTSCRQGPFVPAEVHRVLKPGGFFLTQQVGEGDKYELKKCLGRGQRFQQPPGQLKDNYVNQLRQVEFQDVKVQEYNAIEYYSRPRDLLLLLKNAPIVPDFGKRVGDFQKLAEYINRHTTKRGIKTNAKRFLLTAKK